jgi:hypothetical protein
VPLREAQTAVSPEEGGDKRPGYARALVPLAFRGPAGGYEADEGDDDAEQDASVPILAFP